MPPVLTCTRGDRWRQQVNPRGVRHQESLTGDDLRTFKLRLQEVEAMRASNSTVNDCVVAQRGCDAPAKTRVDASASVNAVGCWRRQVTASRSIASGARHLNDQVDSARQRPLDALWINAHGCRPWNPVDVSAPPCDDVDPRARRSRSGTVPALSRAAGPPELVSGGSLPSACANVTSASRRSTRAAPTDAASACCLYRTPVALTATEQRVRASYPT